MSKFFWWKILGLLLGVGAFFFGLQFDGFHSGLCSNKNGTEECIVEYSPYSKPMLLLSVPFVVILAILFFVEDDIFKKWLKFLIIWSIILTYLLTGASAGDMNLGISKELVAVFMGFILIIFSVFIILYQGYKLKKNK
ncbi:MAG: hypothetical protein ACWGHO_01780 [Candidatus Moraniibacteriota bacterium]|jgi:hypothetical protein